LKDSSTSSSFIRPKNPSGKPTLISGRLKFVNQTSYMQLRLDIEIFSNEERATSLDLRLTDGMGNPIGFGSLGTFDANQLLRLKRGLNSVSFAFPIDQLAVGTYWVSMDLTLPGVEFYDRVENCLSFEIVRPPIEGVKRVLFQSWGYGSLEIPLKILKTQRR
jgi:lipopolysaccharide transport system ATP-binding protein